ncbi:hypothetical protein BAE44_0024329 [Dichanthelium oligosanthes]|uniref:Pentatricopeptide repeat-containing protein n=1 Tax=Dichanthelium oligosanthes TaxID=888268 RepID=A0A1E5UP60_9POAL|nr:hypothetical protein BAE44_0024329 [Dichanthelium oligosanthes]
MTRFPSGLDEFLVTIIIDEDELLGVIGEVAKNGGAAAAEIVCVAFLKVLCRVRKVSRAQKVLQAFADAGLVPTAEMYTIFVDKYYMMGELEGAFSVCRQMHDQPIPSGVIYKALMKGLLEAGKFASRADIVEVP